MEPRSRAERIHNLLAGERNRAILTLLRDAARPLHVNELAERLVARESTLLSSSDHERELERVRLTLHHNHLPKLAEVGLVEYDCEENIATFQDSIAVDAEWLDVEAVSELQARFGMGSGADKRSIGVVEGRESVIERGKQLADEAEEELFLMYVSEDLLEDDCLSHAGNAIERGVDISLGSQNPAVRRQVRSQLPEATIWEPQSDWMDVPSRYPKVGRLVLADREKLMFALLDEPDADGTYAETAVTAEGEQNPLVVLVRKLLGPRLDHLDYQSETFRSELPF